MWTCVCRSRIRTRRLVRSDWLTHLLDRCPVSSQEVEAVDEHPLQLRVCALGHFTAGWVTFMERLDEDEFDFDLDSDEDVYGGLW